MRIDCDILTVRGRNWRCCIASDRCEMITFTPDFIRRFSAGPVVGNRFDSPVVIVAEVNVGQIEFVGGDTACYDCKSCIISAPDRFQFLIRQIGDTLIVGCKELDLIILKSGFKRITHIIPLKNADGIGKLPDPEIHQTGNLCRFFPECAVFDFDYIGPFTGCIGTGRRNIFQTEADSDRIALLNITERVRGRQVIQRDNGRVAPATVFLFDAVFQFITVGIRQGFVQRGIPFDNELFRFGVDSPGYGKSINAFGGTGSRIDDFRLNIFDRVVSRNGETVACAGNRELVGFGLACFISYDIAVPVIQIVGDAETVIAVIVELVAVDVIGECVGNHIAVDFQIDRVGKPSLICRCRFHYFDGDRIPLSSTGDTRSIGKGDNRAGIHIQQFCFSFVDNGQVFAAAGDHAAVKERISHTACRIVEVDDISRTFFDETAVVDFFVADVSVDGTVLIQHERDISSSALIGGV